VIRPPFFSRLMIGSCFLVFVLQLAGFNDVIVSRFSIYAPALRAGEWWRLFSSGFVHGSLMHLGFNMLMLYILSSRIGPALSTSPWRFPFLYGASLFGGSLGAVFLEPNLPAIGASGAVFGLGGAVLMYDRFQAGGWNSSGALTWLGLNLVLTFAVPGISVGGHLGGLLAGGLVGWWFFKPAPGLR